MGGTVWVPFRQNKLFGRGGGMGPSKKNKAEKLGIPIIDESTFF